jgi:hypothetical protein
MMPFRKQRPDEAAHPEGRIIPIVTVDNQMIADMMLGILRMHDIRCMARPRGMGMAYLGPALQAHDILVLDRDKEQAEEILRAFSDDEEVKLLWR